MTRGISIIQQNQVLRQDKGEWYENNPRVTGRGLYPKGFFGLVNGGASRQRWSLASPLTLFSMQNPLGFTQRRSALTAGCLLSRSLTIRTQPLEARSGMYDCW